MGLFKRFIGNNEIMLAAPISGEIIDLDNVPDETFKTRILGDGAAIIPNSDTLCASDNGTVLSVSDTKHAIVLEYSSGIEVLMHIGIDTVELNGNGFTALVNSGDKVKIGDKLIKIDLDYIKSRGYSVITPIIITNTDEFKSVNHTSGQVSALDEFIRIKK